MFEQSDSLFHCTVVGFKLRGHFKFFFIIMSDLNTFVNERVSIVLDCNELMKF